MYVFVDILFAFPCFNNGPVCGCQTSLYACSSMVLRCGTRKFAMTTDGSTIVGAGHMSAWVSTDNGASWVKRMIDGKWDSRSSISGWGGRAGSPCDLGASPNHPAGTSKHQAVGLRNRSHCAKTLGSEVGRWGEAEEMLSLIIQFPKNLQPKQIQIPEEGVGISADGSKMVMGGIEINMFKSDGGGNFQTGWNDAQLSSATSQKLRDLAMSSDGNIIVTGPDMVRRPFWILFASLKLRVQHLQGEHGNSYFVHYLSVTLFTTFSPHAPNHPLLRFTRPRQTSCRDRSPPVTLVMWMHRPGHRAASEAPILAPPGTRSRPLP